MIKRLLLPILAGLFLLAALPTKAQSLYLDYASMDDQYSQVNGDTTYYYIWDINKNLPADSVFTTRFASVIYDSIWNWNYNTGSLTQSYNVNNYRVRLDSFQLVYRHLRPVTASTDTLYMYIYDPNNVNYDANTGLFTGPWLWRDSIKVSGSGNLSSSGSVYSGTFNQLFRRPNLTLNQGQTYGIYIEFRGNVRNRLQVINGYRDECLGACHAEPSIVFNSIYYLNLATNSALGFPYYYDCVDDNTATPGGCEDIELQNFFMPSWVTLLAPTGSNPTVNITPTNIKCFGQGNGSATAVAGGGNGTYSYQWNTGSTNATINNLQPGTYTVTVTSNGQTASASVNISQPSAALSASATSTPSTGSDGTATASGTGGTAPYLYSWNNGQTSQTATGLAANAYSVTITDANNCSASATVSVQQGSVSSSCDTVANVDFGLLTVYPADDQDITAGYLSGNNKYGDIAKAEQFTSTAGRKVTAGFLGFAHAVDGGAASNVTVKIWDASGTNGGPGVELDAVSVPLSFIITAVSQQQLVVVNFPNEPVLPTNNFYIGVELPTTPGDTLVLYTDEITTNGFGRGWEQEAGGDWFSYNENWFQQPSTAQLGNAIAASICDAQSSGTCTPDAGVTQGWSPAPGSVSCATQGQSFTQTYTFYVPSSAGGAPVTSITIDSIVNLPSGLTWTQGGSVYPANSLGCFTVSGNTNAACGQYIMHVWVTINTSFGPFSADLVDITTQFSVPGYPEQYIRVNTSGACPPLNTSQTLDFVSGSCGGSGLSVTFNPTTNVSCFGGSNGSATAVGGGGTTYTYAWSNGLGTNATVNNLQAGTYSVTVTSNGQTASASVNITQPNALSTSTSSTASSGSNGTASVVAIGGNGSYQYLWNNGQTSQTAVNLAPATYTVTVTDSKGCTASASVTVAQGTGGVCTPAANAPFGISPTSDLIPCITRGTSFSQTVTFKFPTTFTFSGTTVNVDSVRIDNITNLPNGITYTADKNPARYKSGTSGCVLVTGTTNDPCGQYKLSVLVTAYTNIGILGPNLDLSTVGINGPFLRVISSGNTCPAVDTAQSTGFTAYNTCTATSNLSVSITPTHVNCFGQSTGSATATGSGGTTYTYNWSTGASGATLSGLAAGGYSVTVTSNGQTASASVNITQPSAALNVSVTTTATQCGSNTGTATATVTGGTSGYTYSWTGGGTGSTKSSLAAGSYNVTVTDSKGCTAVASGTVGSPATFNLSVTTTNAFCFGQNSGTATATVTGGSGPFTYSWNNSSTAPALNNVAAGTYSVTVTDGAGCTKTASGTITQPSSAVTATATATQSSCSGSTGTASVTANGGTTPYTYLWSNSSTATSLSSLAPGTYNVTVSDNKGCTATASANVGSPATFNLSIAATNALCFGQNSGTATVTVTGGTTPYTYNWSSGSTTANASSLVSGNYIVTVTDASGCAKSTSVSVGQPTQISASTTTTNSNCGGTTGSATVTATGGTPGYTYLWSNNTTTATASSLAAGSYSVTVRDNNQCVAIAQATVIAPSTTTITISATDVVCYGASTGAAFASVTGGTTPYNFAWSSGATTQGISSITAGSYTVTVTDGGGCSKTSSVTINQPASPLTVSASAQSSTCGASTGSVAATVTGNTGNTTYQWSANANNATTSTVNNLGSGLYSVTVTSGGCSATNSVAVNNSNGPSVVLLETHPSCFNSNDGQITASVSGGTGSYTYTWTGGGNQASISGLDGGTYTVVVKDGANCQATAFITLVEPTAITLNANTTGAACNGTQTGSIALNVSGGTAPYAYSWSTSNNTSSIQNLLAGNYTVTVTDSKSCTVSSTINVQQPAVLTCTTTSTASVGGGSTGTATATAAGGTSPYTYVWSNSQTGATATGLAVGNFTVTITDSKGCTATATANVLVSGINEAGSSAIKVALYPNPANETINVIAELESSHNTVINITDVTGKLVYNTHESVNGKLNHQINVRDFNSGVYIMEVIVDKQATRKRFVVSH